MKISSIKNINYNSSNYRVNKNSNNNIFLNNFQNTKNPSLKNDSNLSFKGLISSIKSAYEQNRQEKQMPYFEDSIKSVQKGKIILSHILEDLEDIHTDSLDKFNNIYDFATYTNPIFHNEIDTNRINISTLTGVEGSYICYNDEDWELPFTKTKQTIKKPVMVVIGHNKTNGIVQEIYNLDEKIVYKNVKQLADNRKKAERIVFYDINECKNPFYRFLKTMHTKRAVFNNVEIDKYGRITAKSLITSSPLKNGTTRIDDVYINPAIKQPRCNPEENFKSKGVNWRVILESSYKFSSIGGLKYTNPKDYIKKTIVQRNPKEIYQPLEGLWSGKADFYMEPVIEKNKKYCCALYCKTLENEVVNSLKSELFTLA